MGNNKKIKHKPKSGEEDYSEWIAWDNDRSSQSSLKQILFFLFDCVYI